MLRKQELNRPVFYLYCEIWVSLTSRLIERFCNAVMKSEPWYQQQTRIMPWTNRNSKQNRATSVRRWKTCNGCQARETALWFCSWLVERKKHQVCWDWLELLYAALQNCCCVCFLIGRWGRRSRGAFWNGSRRRGWSRCVCGRKNSSSV